MLCLESQWHFHSTIPYQSKQFSSPSELKGNGKLNVIFQGDIEQIQTYESRDRAQIVNNQSCQDMKPFQTLN